MSSKSVEEIANAVLYEGYMLYPYRASSVKNRVRWNFGVVYPKEYSQAQGEIDPWVTQTECLIHGTPETQVSVKVRFLQTIDRLVSKADASLSVSNGASKQSFRPVAELRVGEQVFQTWQEAMEREVSAGPIELSELGPPSMCQPFALPATVEYEDIGRGDGEIAGIVKRTRERIEGNVEVSAACLGDGTYKLTLRVSNATPLKDPASCNRDRALMHSLLSSHAILRVHRGQFVSLLDTPEDLRGFASVCTNIGTWPVLAGDENQRDTMLSSPIILYDYPQIAPESAGDLYDGTEIDEILALRILTLTDDEKRQMREGDERARQILERTEALPAEEFAKLHGALRGLRLANEDRQ